MRRVVIRGGWVLSMDRQVGNHRQADVAIEDGKIVEVGPNLSTRQAEVVDAREGIVMPGFVDTHRHLGESLGKNRPHPTLTDPPGRPGEAEHVYAATLAGLVASVEAGITTVVDHFDLPPEHVEAALDAHRDAGVRTVLAFGSDPSHREEWPNRVRALTGSSLPALTTLAAAPPTYVEPADTEKAWSAGRELGLRIHTHAQPGPPPAGSLLGSDVTLVHCPDLGEDGFRAMAAAGASAAVAAQAEMAGGLGAPPMQELIDHGIRIGLAVGSERAAPADLFAAMRAAISVQHATHFDKKLAGKGGLPNLLTTRDVIRYATVEGAAVAGLEAVTGSLSPGKRADVIVLRTDRPNIFPINDPIGAVVWGMDTSNLEWVFVDGQPLMREGEVQGDTEHVKRLVAAVYGRLAAGEEGAS